MYVILYFHFTQIFSGRNSNETNDFSGTVDVVFHRTESTDQDETKATTSDAGAKDPEARSQGQSTFRSHGRSISREDCNKKVDF